MNLRVFFAIPALLAGSAPARADPIITPIVASIVAAAGITGTAAAITTAVVSAIITTAIGIGLSLIFAPGRPKTPPAENSATAVQQPIPYFIYGYGRARIAGSIVFKEANVPYLGYIAVLNAHPVSAIQGYFLNDDVVTVSPVGGATPGFVIGDASARYKTGYIALESRLGLVPETAYQKILDTFGSIYTTDFRGDGRASLMMRCYQPSSNFFSTIFPYAIPQPSALVDQYIVFDPRDVTQSALTPSTWKFSKNPALCIMHYECFCEFGPLRNYATAILPVLALWIAEANVCDEQVSLKAGGTEKRYELGGWITTESSRSTPRQTMLATCDGWFIERGDGTVVLVVGKFRTPTVFLTDDDILRVHYDRGIPSDERVNQATAKYTSITNNYTSVESDPYIDLIDQTARRGAPRVAQLDLTWVQSTGQSYRLLKREFLKQAETHRGTMDVGLTGLNACYERWIGINSNTYPFLNGKVIENKRPVISLLTARCQIGFVVSGAQIDVYDSSVDEGAPPIAVSRPSNTPPPAPANPSVVVEQATDPSGVSSIFLNVSWDVALSGGSPWLLSYTVQYRVQDTGGGVPGAWTQQTYSNYTPVAGRISIATGNVPVGTTLDVQILVASAQNSATALISVNTSLTAAAPASPTSFTATGHTGNATLSCPNPSSANLSYIRFFRASHGSPFTAAVALGVNQSAAPGGMSSYTDTTAAGTYDWFVVAYNSSAVGSAPTGPATAAIT